MGGPGQSAGSKTVPVAQGAEGAQGFNNGDNTPMNSPLERLGNLRRRLRLGALILAAAAAVLGCGGGGSDHAESLQATWTASPSDFNAASAFGTPPATYIENQTIRQVMRVSAGGSGVRVKLSNLFGPASLKIDEVHIARSAGGATIDPASDVKLKFNGQDAVTIAAGQEVWSDVASASVAANTDVTVTMYVSGKMQLGTYHQLAVEQTYVATGNASAAADITPIAPNATSYYWLAGIDVRNASAKGVIVTFGDSITDGFNSTVDGSKRYPNDLSLRVAADARLAGFSVANAGISGNRILHDSFGPNGEGRFDRDALQTTGVTHVIVLLGINDIGFSNIIPTEAVTADQITAGLQNLVDQAKAKKVKIYLATLTPFDHAIGPDGNPSPYYDDASEAKRQQVNAWIRANTAKADGIIDFDAALRDPSAPSKILSAYDSGDHLHPNDAGYQVMANAIDLSLFY
jgi:lysophospholipase L1-like esterase